MPSQTFFYNCFPESYGFQNTSDVGASSKFEYNLMQFRISTNISKDTAIQPTSEHLDEPINHQQSQETSQVPINGDNFFQKIFFTWCKRLVSLNQLQEVKVANLPTLPEQYMAEREFENYKANLKQYSQMGLLNMLLKVFGCDLCKLVFLCILTEVFYLCYPILIYYNIDYLQNHRDSVNYGIVLFIITIVISFLYNLTYTNLKYLFKILGVNISTHLNLLIYYKSLKYSLTSNKKFAESDIISYSQIDTDNMMYIGSKLAYFIFGLIEIFAGFGLLYWFVGYSFVAGLIVLVVISVFTFVIGSCNVHLGEEVLEKKDERLSATEQLLNIIRFVKQNAYEKLYFKKIKQWREKQLLIYKRKGTIEATTVFLYYLTAPSILTSVILTYLYIYNEMSPSSVFTTMMIAMVFEVTSQQFPKATSELIAVINSIKRIDLFLSAKQIQNKRHSRAEDKKQDRFSISIKNGEFFIKPKTLMETKQKIEGKKRLSQDKNGNISRISLNNSLNNCKDSRKISINLNQANVSLQQLYPSKPIAADQLESSVDSVEDYVVVLKNINLNIERGKLYMIYGDIGSGKSSLLLSILNEYNLQKKSEVQINGKISYVSQKPWIFSGTIQSNIQFLHDKNQKRLQEAIKYSCLEDDMKLFPNGKDTQIGENGINLSGGQKFRVDLARSLYSNSDIYLYDDILSAVDIHVATFIMENAIKDYLQGKTIVMATHAIKFAQMADYIILLKKGQISACQSYENIRNNPDFQEIQSKIMQEEQQKNKTMKHIQMEKGIIKAAIQQSQIAPEFPQDDNQDKVKVGDQSQIQTLMLPEDKQKGSVDFKIFKEYIKLNGGYFCFFIPVLACLICYSVLQTTASILISLWSDSNGSDGYLYIFVGLTLSANIFIFFQALILTFTGVKQGKSVHNNIIKGLLYANLTKFYNRVPLGRIVNRLSKDLKEMDEVISNTFCSSLTTACKILSAIVISIYTSTPFTLIPVFIVAILFVKLRNVYIASQNQLMRLQKATNTPLVVGFTNGIRGAALIRSYRCEDKFLLSYIQNVNNYKRVLYNRFGLTSWFILVLVYMTYLINMFSIGFCMFGPNINPSYIGLLLAYILNFNDELFQFVIDQTDFQTQLISLQRLYKLMNLSPEEKYVKYCEEWNQEEEKLVEVFNSGKIQFKNVSVRYRQNLPKVINNLNVIIKDGEKIGVVGRTGSGKSTILNTLLQITEVSQGQILIDNAPLKNIGLKDLRKAITVIDQEPVLLNSTFRQNLDINSEYSDEQLQNMMKECNIYDIISSRGGLDGKIGNNSLSAGEKQLICICRAVLKKTKIVLIDQATANIDIKNDTLIQKVINQKFAGRTVLMIAHRLSSLSNYDKIMVMEAGRLIQYGCPKDLMDKKGVYFEMMKKYKSATH